MGGKVKRKIHKYYEYIVTKVALLLKQKNFNYYNVDLKYILERCEKSNDLIVVFSSCTRHGLKARYNYMRTLSAVPSNKLFILDDFSEDRRGSYYLGPDWSFAEEKATVELIRMVKMKEKISGKSIFCGSSKGGYSAINFGLQFDASFIVAGAPQYFLSQYLKASGNIACFNHIVGNETEDKCEELDCRLRNRIRSCANPSQYKIFLNYSNCEHTFTEHIADMVKDLDECGFEVSSAIESYENHSDISLYFPDFLKRTISNILADKEE